MLIAAERIRFLAHKRCHLSLSLARELRDAVVSKLRSQLVPLAGNMHCRNKAVGFPAAKTGLQSENWSPTAHTRETLCHLLHQELEILRRMRASEETQGIALVFVRCAGDDIPQVRREDRVRELSCKHLTARLAEVEDRRPG